MYTPADYGLLGSSARKAKKPKKRIFFLLLSFFFAATLQSGLHLYTPADSGFAGVVSQSSHTQLSLAHWGGQPGLLLYTSANSGLLGWSARVPNVYPRQLWFVGVVSQGSYYIPQLTGSLE